MQAVEYVRQRDGGWYVSNSGVSVYSVITLWGQGYSPEEIQASFSPLSLQDVYGTILYYILNTASRWTLSFARKMRFSTKRRQ
jgi:uncharacterized protein (DUF433 family)